MRGALRRRARQKYEIATSHPHALEKQSSGARATGWGVSYPSRGDNGAKPAQSGNESELSKFFAKIEIEFNAAEMFLPVKNCEIAFHRQFEQTDYDQHRERDQTSRHNSLP